MITNGTPAERIDQLNKRFAVVTIGGYARDTVVAEFSAAGDVVGTHKFDAFKRFLYDEPPIALEVPDERKGRAGTRTVYHPLADYWLRHPDKRRYNALVFVPPGSRVTLDPNDHNTWCGFAVAPVAGDWSMARYHIRNVICSGDLNLERWVHNWIAAMLQKPGLHGAVALVLTGPQGGGKGVFTDKMLGGLFRRANYVQFSKPEQLTGDFNSQLENRVLVFADEAMWIDRSGADKLKALVTEDTIEINRKHMPQETQQSCLHIIIASNAERPFPVEPNDRRFCVLRVADIHLQDLDYFEALLEELENGGRAAMLDYFMTFPVDWQLARKAPETQAKRDMKSASLSVADSWWLDVLMTADAESWHPWETQIGNKAMHVKYSRWFDQNINGRAIKHNGQQLGTWLSKHFARGGMPDWPQKAGKVSFVAADGIELRDHAKRFPSLAECRAVFDRATGTRQDWPTDEDDEQVVQATAA